MFTKWYYKLLPCGIMSCVSTNYNVALKNYKGTLYNVNYQNCRGGSWLENTLQSPLNNSTKDSISFAGVVFGNGDAQPTIDDYQLSGEHFKNFSSSYAHSYDANTNEGTITYTLVNNNDSDFTIREVGVFATSSVVLMIREVLDSPVTIPAGGIGQVTLTIKVAIPEA